VCGFAERRRRLRCGCSGDSGLELLIITVQTEESVADDRLGVVGVERVSSAEVKGVDKVLVVVRVVLRVAVVVVVGVVFAEVVVVAVVVISTSVLTAGKNTFFFQFFHRFFSFFPIVKNGINSEK